ncbi:MAG: bifunctional D-glycero-beta-D-manno-heptose-7-phosphate kinase/D-glycero-beta-D-manno-heptose 1-phosphate adenylyltransferase HldE [Desulfosarcinaceae bacterium]|nr:bifunctional D-glycero-beta-D-manno-heptose-7-phosphate kinase/D-glycero-beta-D-manno-heptose 1-phosphate adenylyltransferase HldE [Desulfosarcinaceae bacterium]
MTALSMPDYSTAAVLVVGDVMLDRYFWGEVTRISPEAPVPVVRVTQKSQALGGAGNVALNIAGLGANVQLLGVRGSDSQGDYLENLLGEHTLAHALIATDDLPTTTKTRILGQGQQLLRMDEEAPRQLAEATLADLKARIAEALPQAGAVILSDYGKGVFLGDLAAWIIAACRRRRLPVLVDPKGSDWERYRGATAITPNTAEFQAVAGAASNEEGQLTAQAEAVRDRFDLQWLLVTRGSHGLSLMGMGQPSLHIRSRAQEVFDVSGAGDTVIATLAASLAAGATMPQAAEIANAAAGVVVAKVGTQAIQADELARALRMENKATATKIMDLQAAAILRQRWRAAGRQVVFTNGCFDILHVGHLQLLNAAAQLGDRLIVGVNSDASVKRLKGDSRPVTPDTQRMTLLAGLACVDMVVKFDTDTPLALIRKLSPDVLVKGGDYTPDTVVGRDIVEASGGRVAILPLVPGVSTTRVIERIAPNGRHPDATA